MDILLKRLALAIASAGALTMYGCGGGGGGGTTSSTPSTTLSGVAATGAAFTDAIITVKDRTGASVGTASVGADGTYTVTLIPGAAAPFVLVATRTTTDGATESLVSVVPSVSGASATANISPITSLIASRLTASGDPLKLADEVAANPAIANASTVDSKVQEVQTILAPILTATNTGGTNPLTGSFAANGTGYDWLLDSIKVTIIPSSSTTTNIQVDVKQQVADGVAPVSIQFTNTTTTAPTLPVITAPLVVEGTAAKIAAHLAQLNACFALPLSSRITSGGTTAANIQATECKSAFFGNDPSTFKSSGAPVGKGKAFNGIFVSGGNNVVFSRGTYEFTRANGDIVIGYRSWNPNSNSETFDTFALREDTDGKLKQIGNQYVYPGGVSAYQQSRHFITLSQSAFDYFSTGYNLNVDDVLSGGVSIFDRVEVTSPRGVVLTLKPRTGYSYLPLVKGGTVTGTSFIRLNSEYMDTANTADPALKDTIMFFADRSVFTNDVIATLPAQSVWKFDYFLAGNAGSTPNATQYYKTRARALTIPELKTKGLATLLPAAIADIQTQADPITGQVAIGGAASIPMNYSVATGALPPTKLQIWGGYSSGSFTDSATVSSTARTGSIACTMAGADTHCTLATGGVYVPSATVNGGHLWARDPDGRDYASFYAMYKLP